MCSQHILNTRSPVRQGGSHALRHQQSAASNENLANFVLMGFIFILYLESDVLFLLINFILPNLGKKKVVDL